LVAQAEIPALLLETVPNLHRAAALRPADDRVHRRHDATRPVYFTYIFSFATLRLWGTVAILIFALCESYRQSAPAPAAGNR
jgi:hypothetical protein